MEHHHDHSHHHHSTGSLLLLSLALTLAFSLVEAIAGWWSGSLALFSDAGHMVSDSFALGVAALAAVVALRKPSYLHSYGLGRAEFVGALFNAALMLLIVVAIAVSAVNRLLSPQPVEGGVVATVALIGLVINIAVAWVLSRGEGDLNTRAALLHVMGDLLGSVAALIAGAVIYYTGWTPIDPLLSLFIVALILVSTLRLLRESMHGLMEGVPLHLSLQEVGKALAQVDGVKSVHDLHIWSLSSHHVALSAHVIITDMACWENTLAALQDLLLEQFHIEHVTLQPETLAGDSVPLPLPGCQSSRQ
ncbi:MAG TPA: cation diffusion facilitator family transporter [Gammaproteobacteria bacterium]